MRIEWTLFWNFILTFLYIKRKVKREKIDDDQKIVHKKLYWQKIPTLTKYKKYNEFDWHPNIQIKSNDIYTLWYQSNNKKRYQKFIFTFIVFFVS